MAAFGGPLPWSHMLPASLAACSPGANCLEKAAPQPAAFGEACACETVGFYGRLRKKPTLKIGPIAAGRRRMNQALHSRVLKDSMVTLYSSASSFLIARRATASWFNLSKWSATLKAAPSQLAAAG